MINYELTNFDSVNGILEIKYTQDGQEFPYYVNTTVPREFTEDTLHQVAKQNAFQASRYWKELGWIAETEVPFTIQTTIGVAKPTLYDDVPEYDQGLQQLTPTIVETDEAYVNTFEVRDYTKEELSYMFRIKRDALLGATDKYAMADRTIPPEMVAYRQALRDITAQPEFPYNVVWPIKPAE
jgi:hypothetical protein